MLITFDTKYWETQTFESQDNDISTLVLAMRSFILTDEKFLEYNSRATNWNDIEVNKTIVLLAALDNYYK